VVDIAEGLDLSLLIFGDFQSHVTHNREAHLPVDGVVLDVGANVGIMTLNFARACPSGHVYAFEPTCFALEKLKRNISLNPELADNILVTQAFVTAPGCTENTLRAYSSWRVDKSPDKADHPVHGGTPMDTEGAISISLDDFVKKKQIDRVDLLKIDTDGYELDVLKGATEVLQAYRPSIIFEIGQYLIQERGQSFQDFYDLLKPLGYELRNTSNQRIIDTSNAQDMIPAKGTIDVIAIAH